MQCCLLFFIILTTFFNFIVCMENEQDNRKRSHSPEFVPYTDVERIAWTSLNIATSDDLRNYVGDVGYWDPTKQAAVVVNFNCFMCPRPVLAFCKKLQEARCAVFVISSCLETDENTRAVRKKLEELEVAVAECYLMPIEIARASISIADWKRVVRMRCGQRYNVVAHVGTEADDFDLGLEKGVRKIRLSIG